MAERGWAYQHVVEGDFRFDRVWRNLPGGRLMLHVLEPNESTFWHPHAQALEVWVLGPGPYEVSFGVERLTSGVSYPQEVATVVCQGPFYYRIASCPSATNMHTVRTHGPCVSVVLQHIDGDPKPALPPAPEDRILALWSVDDWIRKIRPFVAQLKVSATTER